MEKSKEKNAWRTLFHILQFTCLLAFIYKQLYKNWPLKQSLWLFHILFSSQIAELWKQWRWLYWGTKPSSIFTQKQTDETQPVSYTLRMSFWLFLTLKAYFFHLPRSCPKRRIIPPQNFSYLCEKKKCFKNPKSAFWNHSPIPADVCNL